MALTSAGPPPCITNISQLVYRNGALSAGDTMERCLENVPDPKLIPILYNGTYFGPLQVQTALQVNQIQDIDAVGGKATLDFYLEFIWQDNRFNMPVFWEKIDPYFQEAGIRIQRRLYNSSGLFFWTPDYFFHDGLQVTVMGEVITVNASNHMYWQQHIAATLAESLYDFANFPYDQQLINVRYGSFAFNSTFLNLTLRPNEPLSYVPNYDGRENLRFNSEWAYDESDAFWDVYYTNGAYSDAIFVLPMDRYANGIIIRIIIPIAILLLLAALTFWAATPETRVSATSALFIAVAALYIITIGYVPLVGYETAVDAYVLVMFAIIAVMICFHIVDMILDKHIYSTDEDVRTLVQYSRPVHYLKCMLLRCFCPSGNKQVEMQHDYDFKAIEHCQQQHVQDVRDAATEHDDAHNARELSFAASAPAEVLKKQVRVGAIDEVSTPKAAEQEAMVAQGDAEPLGYPEPNMEGPDGLGLPRRRDSMGGIALQDIQQQNEAFAAKGAAKKKKLKNAKRKILDEAQSKRRTTLEHEPGKKADGSKKSRRDMEHEKPVLTLTMLAVQMLGRITFLPLIFILTAYDMLRPVAENYNNRTSLILSQTCLALAIIAFVVVFTWELWHVMCKFWELQCVNDIFQEERETLMHSYIEMVGFMATLEPGSNKATQDDWANAEHHSCAEKVCLAYDRLMREHVHLTIVHRGWLMEMTHDQRLPSPQQQLVAFQSSADLYRVHDTVRVMIAKRLARFINSRSLRTEDSLATAGADEQKSDPEDGSGGETSDAWRTLELPDCSKLRAEYTALVDFQHRILNKYPGLQNKLRNMYGASGALDGKDAEEIAPGTRARKDMLSVISECEEIIETGKVGGGGQNGQNGQNGPSRRSGSTGAQRGQERQSATAASEAVGFAEDLHV